MSQTLDRIVPFYTELKFTKRAAVSQIIQDRMWRGNARGRGSRAIRRAGVVTTGLGTGIFNARGEFMNASRVTYCSYCGNSRPATIAELNDFVSLRRANDSALGGYYDRKQFSGD